VTENDSKDEGLDTVARTLAEKEEQDRDYAEHGPRISVLYGPDADSVSDEKTAPHVYCSRHWEGMKQKVEALGENVKDVDGMMTPFLVQDTVKLMFHESEHGTLPPEIEEKMHCCQRHFSEAASAFLAMKAPLCCYVTNAPEGALDDASAEVRCEYVGKREDRLLNARKQPEGGATKPPAQFPVDKPRHIC